ncbi:hypothetical protein SNK04_012677 [Fusarium graminearum]
MTPDAYRPRDPSIEFAADIDLLAGLWQEAPFARLPSDAPPEVKAAVQNVENPARVYAIHQASRRHGFQLLVERYIHQLRSGCDNANCATPTCFTCRRRLAGKAPVRRYNTTSARTLAIYLASQDDPEKDLCPFFRRTPEASAALNNLIFSTRSPTQSHPDNKRTNVITSPSAHKNRVIRPRTSSSSSQDSISATRQAPHLTSSSASPVRVIEGPVNKDHRSFAANLFGTVTFKMIEWLTPSSMAAMSGKLGNFEVSDLKSSATDLDTLQESSSLTSTSTDLETQKTLPHEPNTPKPTNMVNQPQDTDWDESPFLYCPLKADTTRHTSRKIMHQLNPGHTRLTQGTLRRERMTPRVSNFLRLTAIYGTSHCGLKATNTLLFRSCRKYRRNQDYSRMQQILCPDQCCRVYPWPPKTM